MSFSRGHRNGRYDRCLSECNSRSDTWRSGESRLNRIVGFWDAYSQTIICSSIGRVSVVEVVTFWCTNRCFDHCVNRISFVRPQTRDRRIRFNILDFVGLQIFYFHIMFHLSYARKAQYHQLFEALLCSEEDMRQPSASLNYAS